MKFVKLFRLVLMTEDRYQIIALIVCLIFIKIKKANNKSIILLIIFRLSISLRLEIFMNHRGAKLMQAQT